MKVSEDYILREISDESILVPVGKAAVEFQGIMSLNESGKLLWDKLQDDISKDALVTALLDVYDTTPEIAKKDVTIFLNQLREHKILLD